MGKKHFLLFDFLLPLAGILLVGNLLARRFAAAILQRVDAIKAFGLGFEFAHSGLRASLLHHSWLAFALVPAAGWLVWVRLNLECDFRRGRIRLDRPLYTFFKVLRDRLAGIAAPPPAPPPARSGAGPLPAGGPHGRERQAAGSPAATDSPAPPVIGSAPVSASASSRPEWPDDVMPPARPRQR